jgi:predicted nuclease of restriction endonuclease-like (RecB) superfamily
MTAKKAKASSKPSGASVVSGYVLLLAELKDRVRVAQLRAAQAANRELLKLYWDIGRLLQQSQRREGWGAAVIPRLAGDLAEEFPELQGFSERNLGYMIRFAREYGEPPILQPPVAKLIGGSPGTAAFKGNRGVARELAGPAAVATDSILQRVVAKLPWAHHVTLLDRVKDRAERFWYMQQALEHGWSRSVLTAQIAAKAHRGAGKAITNFATTLPPVQSDLAQQTLKDPYVFDFLTLGLAAREREFEQGLIDHIQKFLVTLGVGFAFVGRQVHLEVGGQDYYLDLLFYHLKLRCFVVIDLKVEAFKPEFAGKMNFYLSAVDAQMRHQDDRPTIGLLLCQENNRITVEYALREVKKPIGVAQWKTKLVDSLPKNFRGALPTVQQIERELAKG